MDTSERSVFREKSLEHLSTPKQFNDSLQVTKASMWVALTAVLILLAGLLVWAIFGYLEVTIQAYGIADDGVITSYIAGDSAVTIGMEARIDDTHNPQNLDEQVTGVITAVDLVATNVGETTDDPSVSVNSLRPADHSFMVTISAPGVSDGIVDVTILKERIHPISFLTGRSR